MSNRYDKLNVTRAFTTNFLLCNLYTASVADDSLITDTLVLAAGAFIVLSRTKNTLAEQAITLRLICTIINGFRFSNLTIRIFQDLLWRSETDGNLRKIILYLCIFFESHVSIYSALIGLDQVAYVRFASVYRRFEDVDQFVNEVKSMHQPGEAPAPDATETEEGADGHG